MEDELVQNILSQSTPEAAFQRAQNRRNWKDTNNFKLKAGITDMLNNNQFSTLSGSKLQFPVENFESILDRAQQKWAQNEAVKRAEERLEKEKEATPSIASIPYDITRGWRDSTENAAKLDKYIAEELGASPEEAQQVYNDTWSNANKTLGIATAATLGIAATFGATGGAFGPVVADIANGLFAVDAARNLASGEGIQKTFRLARQGDWKGALKSGAWDALDWSMLGHTAGLVGRVGKSVLNGRSLGNAYRTDVAGRLFNTAVKSGYRGSLPTTKTLRINYTPSDIIGSVKYNPEQGWNSPYFVSDTYFGKILPSGSESDVFESLFGNIVKISEGGYRPSETVGASNRYMSQRNRLPFLQVPIRRTGFMKTPDGRLSPVYIQKKLSPANPDLDLYKDIKPIIDKRMTANGFNLTPDDFVYTRNGEKIHRWDIKNENLGFDETGKLMGFGIDIYKQGGILKAQKGRIIKSLSKAAKAKKVELTGDLFAETPKSVFKPKSFKGYSINPEAFSGIEHLTPYTYGHNRQIPMLKVREINIPKPAVKTQSGFDSFLQKSALEQNDIVKFWNGENFSSFEQLQKSPKEFKAFQNWWNRTNKK